VTRDFVTLYIAPVDGAPTIDLIKGSSSRVVVFAKLVEPQPPNLPSGLVAIELPPNCYVNIYEGCHDDS
jgi:hypothetical protein